MEFEVQIFDNNDNVWLTILMYDTAEQALYGMARHINSRMNTYERMRIIRVMHEWYKAE